MTQPPPRGEGGGGGGTFRVNIETCALRRGRGGRKYIEPNFFPYSRASYTGLFLCYGNLVFIHKTDNLNHFIHRYILGIHMNNRGDCTIGFILVFTIGFFEGLW